MDSQSQILNFYDASYDKSNSNNEELYCTPIDSMIHNFLESPKTMDYDNIMYIIAPSQHFHLLGLFKDKRLKKIKNQRCFIANLYNFQKIFRVNK
jgi:hypothetical protein